jgi:tRNA G10  N-methylase Trm11
MKTAGEDDESKSSMYDSYIAFVPRGLEHVIIEMLHQQFGNDNINNNTSYYIKTNLLGEDLSDSDIPIFVSSVRNKLQDVNQKRHKDHNNNNCTSISVIEQHCTSTLVGTVEISKNQHVSIGYLSNQTTNIWTETGEMAGTVWLNIITNIPIRIIANHIRYIGPIIAFISYYPTMDFNNNQSVTTTSNHIRDKIIHDTMYTTKFHCALQLWKKHVTTCWSDVIIDNTNSIVNRSILKYRISCLRNNSKKYPYTRRELLPYLDYLLPYNDNYNHNNNQNEQQQQQQQQYTVDLTKYDFEIVVFYRTNCCCIGITIRPYQYISTRSFASGSIPPDISIPIVTNTPRLVRLRSTTANILLYIAKLQYGDILFDPCCGIGTIPIEAHIQNQNQTIFGIGGDLILNNPSMKNVALDYLCKASNLLRRNTENTSTYNVNTVADLLAWDALNIPLRNNTIDVIVSDLPFGQLCMSSSKLDIFLPLLIAEMARILRPSSGRMVLLCGSYIGILKALYFTNNVLSMNKNEPIWDLPCKAVFPVNIGGTLAWIVHVYRSNGIVKKIPEYRERVRKEVQKREHTEKMMQGKNVTKTKHPQA